ncbi:unnamed protein product [Brachionus calyciflorus]|uniref:Uncharacterized protein n=1 Tax=Brachionus calyciflorus TaxID=104777 RepID=A0A814AI48_9BILA|nr:unnamed protein product [Brachionus calyciflorus]
MPTFRATQNFKFFRAKCQDDLIEYEELDKDDVVSDEMNMMEREFQNFFPDGILTDYVEVDDKICTNMSDVSALDVI